MKWVVPTSIRKWYSFGTHQGPAGGAFGFQFSTKGYKTFLMITDTWGRQEQWIRAIETSVEGSLRSPEKSIKWDSAMAIEVDNEVDVERPVQLIDAKKLHRRRSVTENDLEVEKTKNISPSPAPVNKTMENNRSRSTNNVHELKTRTSFNVSRFQPKPSYGPSAEIKRGVSSRMSGIRNDPISTEMEFIGTIRRDESLGIRHIVSTSDIQALAKQQE